MIEDADAFARGRVTPALRGLILCLAVKSVLDVLLAAALAVGFYYVAFSPSVDGSLDEAGPEWVRGWAVDHASPDKHVEVQLYINGRFADNRLADYSYPSLVEKGLTKDARHGFLFYTPPLDPGEYEARVYAVHESGRGARRTLRLLGEPLRFRTDAAPAEPFFRGWLEAADQNAVRGWVVDRDRLGTPVEVQLYIDGRFVEARAADQPRADLLAVGVVTDERHGFFFHTPKLAPGEHEARAYAVRRGAGDESRELRLVGRPTRFNIAP